MWLTLAALFVKVTSVLFYKMATNGFNLAAEVLMKMNA